VAEQGISPTSAVPVGRGEEQSGKTPSRRPAWPNLDQRKTGRFAAIGPPAEAETGVAGRGRHGGRWGRTFGLIVGRPCRVPR